jgi:serine protease DegQ
MNNQLHKKLWLIFAQAATISMAILLVLRVFSPNFLNKGQQNVVVNQVESSLNANLAGSYSLAAKKAMPAVVNIFTSKKSPENPHQKFLDDRIWRYC